MIKVRMSASLLLLILLNGAAPLTASAPLSASAAPKTKVAVVAASTNLNFVRVQSMDVKMIFDGVRMVPPSGQVVFIHNNTTYIPLRFMSYALQKSVAWDVKNFKVTVNDPSTSELMIIKEYLMNLQNNQNDFTSKNITLSDVKAKFVFNGNVKALPTSQSSYMLNGTLYVPLRFLSESVGNEIKWDQKTKTITAMSKDYLKQSIGGNQTSESDVGTKPSSTPSPSATKDSNVPGKISYEEITGSTEAQLNSLKAQSQSTLMSIAFEYLAAEDEASKSAIKAKGIQQLSSFTASFNTIIAATEQKLKANGYSTDIIAQYRSAFETELQAGKALAESMGN